MLARSRTRQLFGRLVSRFETTDRVVALTFDDGPRAELADNVASVLESRRVRATFFVLGGDLVQLPGFARRLVASGHELANHGYRNEAMVFKSSSYIRTEIEETDAAIRAAGERGEIYFRPPFGWKLVGLPLFLMRTGRTTVMWDVADSDAPLPASPEGIASYALAKVRPGSIVLLHVWGNKASLLALPKLIDGLRSKGYAFVTVDELLRGHGGPDARQ